jgi:uncharacterized membrane protein YiaA
MQWGPVHTTTAVGFFCGIGSIGYALGWWIASPQLHGFAYFLCSVIVLGTTIIPAVSLFTDQVKPSGQLWGFINGFGIGVALVLVLLAMKSGQPIIPTNSTATVPPA